MILVNTSFKILWFSNNVRLVTQTWWIVCDMFFLNSNKMFQNTISNFAKLIKSSCPNTNIWVLTLHYQIPWNVIHIWNACGIWNTGLCKCSWSGDNSSGMAVIYNDHHSPVPTIVRPWTTMQLMGLHDQVVSYCHCSWYIMTFCVLLQILTMFHDQIIEFSQVETRQNYYTL